MRQDNVAHVADSLRESEASDSQGSEGAICHAEPFSHPECSEASPPVASARRGRALRMAFSLSVFVIAAVAGMIWSGPRHAPAKAATPGLQIDEAYLDFGEVWAQEKFVCELPIHNSSDDDIEIVEFKPSSCCTAEFDPKTLLVQPDQTRKVKITLKLLPSREEAKKPTFAFSLPFFPRLGGQVQPPLHWEVRGQVRNAVSFEPAVVDFEQSLHKGLSFPSRTVTLRRHFSLKDLTVACDRSLADVPT